MATDESQLLQRAIAGDTAAMELLLEARRPRLIQYVQRHLPQELRTLFEADDILQDTYFEAFRRIGQFAPGGEDPLYRWLVTIARHRMLFLLRGQRAAKRGGGPVLEADAPAPDESVVALLKELALYTRTPSQSAARHEAMAALQQGLERLPQDYRQAIRLRHLEGLTVKEAAAKMNRTEHAFHMLCYRGLQALRLELRSASLYL